MIHQKIISGRAWVDLLLLGLIWGGSFLSVRIALDEIPVMTAVLHRTFWAMLVLWGRRCWTKCCDPKPTRASPCWRLAL